MTDAASKLQPAVFAKDGSVVAAKAAPFKAETFSPSDSAETRARQLGSLQDNVKEATEATRLNDWNQARYFRDIAVTAAANFSVEHKLGRSPAKVAIVRWKPTVAGTPIGNPPPEVELTDTKGTWTATAAGTLTLAVW